MASTSRQPKPGRKGIEAGRRPGWSGPRASPTFAPRSSSPRGPPAPAQPNGTRPDRVLQSLAGLTGTTVTLTTKASARFEGVIRSVATDGDSPGVSLADVKDLSVPGAPLKDSFFISATNIDSYSSGPADSFRTDADIGQKKTAPARERELQAWQPDSDAPPTLTHDDDTFVAAPSGASTAWDQFAVNEKLFGVSGGFNEDEYTTKLDRNAAGFKERELEASRIAAEILGATTNNPHVREERGIDDSGVNEEDKYGAVVRGEGAYIPPGARKGLGGALSPPATKQEVPKVSVNGPDGTALVQPTPPDTSPSPAPPKDALPAFREFVSTEKQRLTRKRQALVKSEMDKRMAELVKFSQNFKLNKPIPEDLVPILAKDEEKQRQIKEKAQKDSESTLARAIGASTAVTASRGVGVGGVLKGALKQPSGGTPSTVGLQKPPVSQQPSSSNTTTQGQAQKSGPTASKSETAVKKIPMFIQSIPPFKGGSKKQMSPPSAASSPSRLNGNATPGVSTIVTNSPASGTARAGTPIATPVSPTTATSAGRLNVNASSFRPGIKGAQAVLTSPAAVASPKLKPETPSNSNVTAANNSVPAANNPFFGTRPIKKSSVTHIKDDFNPFKHAKVPEPNSVVPQWPYHGKRYALLFPVLPHPPPGTGHAPHGAAGASVASGGGAGMGGGIPPGAQPPVPPPPYEDDPAAQAAAAAAARAAAGNAGGAGAGGAGGNAGGGAGVGGGQMGGQMSVGAGYVYPYPPYGYPGQPMMPGMGPPGAYIPTPFMQPMPYPPGMPPPPNAMYPPAMGQMPQYMPPGPPGGYPPPPNGAAPRPSMPPTPIPAHAHPYYHHQSPQLQQAVPYMMMPPPPSGVHSHPYENGPPPPPVQMGGHA